MVIYFGDTQYDILPPSCVVPFASKQKPQGKGTADVVKAYGHALERHRALETLA